VYKASPRVTITEWTKDAVTAAETLTAGDEFTSLGTSYAKMKSGFATITDAYFPDWQMYDRGRVVFSVPTLDADMTDAKLELQAEDADGTRFVLGTSELDTDTGTFPPIEFDVTYEKYFVRAATVTSAGTPGLTVKAAVQGFYRSGLATS
jgi:hypothetical protein